MSQLAHEIVKTLARGRKDRLELTAAEVEATLASLGIPTSAAKGVPVSLRATRIRFSGAKRLPREHADAVGHPVIEVLDAEGGENDGFGPRALPEHVERADADSPAGPEPTPVLRAAVPFAFDWRPQPGVNGIGSGRNLRGKCTINAAASAGRLLG